MTKQKMLNNIEIAKKYLSKYHLLVPKDDLIVECLFYRLSAGTHISFRFLRDMADILLIVHIRIMPIIWETQVIPSLLQLLKRQINTLQKEAMLSVSV